MSLKYRLSAFEGAREGEGKRETFRCIRALKFPAIADSYRGARISASMTGLREKCGVERGTSEEREVSGRLDDSIFDRSNSVRESQGCARARAGLSRVP